MTGLLESVPPGAGGVDGAGILLLAVAALLAGFVDSMAGGGGLVTVPALLTAGLPPTAALATNKLQASFGSFSAALNFTRKGAVDPRTLRPAIVGAFVGSAVGATLVQAVDTEGLERIIPFLLIAIAGYFLFARDVGDHDRHQRLTARQHAATVAPAVGFYDGFFGPGTGSWFALSFVTLRGQGLTKATAHTKVLNFTTNLAALLFFIAGGEVVWLVGLAMAVGQFAGARVGSNLVLARGARLVRPLIVVVSVALSIRLLLSS